jgi:hypothetical protein
LSLIFLSIRPSVEGAQDGCNAHPCLENNRLVVFLVRQLSQICRVFRGAGIFCRFNGGVKLPPSIIFTSSNGMGWFLYQFFCHQRAPHPPQSAPDAVRLK